MPIDVLCPECGVKLRAPDSKAGKRARCGKCGGRVPIPGLPSPGDSRGDSRALIATPAPDDEPVPMALPVPESEADLTPLPPASNPGRPAIDPASTPPPASRTPARPADGLKPRSKPKAQPLATPPAPKTAVAKPVEPVPPPAAEVLSLDDEPPPEPEPLPGSEAAGDPFAFAAPPAPVPKGGSKPRQKGLDSAKESRGPAGDDEQPRRGYVRPGERKSGRRPLLLAGLLGAAAVAAAVGGVVVFNNRQTPAEQAKEDEKPGETPAPAPPGAGDEKGKDGSAPKREKGTNPKDKGAAPKAEPKRPAPAAPAGKYLLPPGARALRIRDAGARTELTQEPSGTPIEVEVPSPAVRRFFAADDRVNRDVVVVWQVREGEPGARFGVDTYSPTTGQRVGRFEYDGDGPGPKCDVSADGKLFAAVTAGGTVGVWNVADRSPVLEGFDPYADKPEHKKAGLAAVFLAAEGNHLVTVSSAGAVHLVDTATRKPLAEFVPPDGTAGRVVAGKNVAADADRRSVVLAVGGIIYQVEAAAGLHVAWKLDLGGAVDRPLGIAAAGVPGRIALAVELGPDDEKQRALLFCLPNERPVVYRLPVDAGEPAGVNWSGTSLAVVPTARGALWVQVDDKVFVPLAMADCPAARGLHAATESYHWYLVGDPKDKDRSRLLALSLPPARFLDFLRAAEKKEPLESPRLDEKGLWK
jgi:hypothetical protein